MHIQLPELSLVVLVGVSGSGKSSFARRFFKPTEIVSSDTMRGLVADDESDQAASEDAFDLLHLLVERRLRRGLLTVVDATNVQPSSRRTLVELARRGHVLPVAIVLDLDADLCVARNRLRPDRRFGGHVVHAQRRELKRSIRGLRDEGFRSVWTLHTEAEVDAATLERQRLWNDRRDDHGPFDIIGDVHGCADELEALLGRLGYVDDDGWRHPEGRKVVFLGDLVDRGPRVVDALRIAMDMVEGGQALCVPGNHEIKLAKKLAGRDVKLSHGLAETLAQLEEAGPDFQARVHRFIDGLVSHYLLDDRRLVVAHAGMKEALQGRASAEVRAFAYFGETTGETDEYGLPVRLDWAATYKGRATVVYGHTPIPAPEWVNQTLNIDTGCVFGGALTALRWPERELVSVPAARVYTTPRKPPTPPRPRDDGLLDLGLVQGRVRIATRLVPTVILPEEQTAAALEAMSRFAADPRWLVHLPPTMSPAATSPREGWLERPEEALDYYARGGADRVVVEEKHMGSRAVLVVGRDPEVIRRRFGLVAERAGVVLSRTGRPFFGDPGLEHAILDEVRGAASRAGLWEELGSDWMLLDAELMPWSAKAQALLRSQYAPASTAARAALDATAALLATAPGAEALHAGFSARARLAGDYTAAWRRYTWPVAGPADLRLAPFHLLASEGAVHVGRDHGWHMAMAERLVAAGGGILHPTRWLAVDPADGAAAVRFWEEHTEAGGEGVVMKPWSFVHGQLQPAIKVRGREYLRIIYGLDYSLPHNLERLRKRSLSAKRALAWREFALGVEALERFVGGAPLAEVHACVFGVLALESEALDPRL